MTDTSYTPLLKALTRSDPNRSLRLPRNPEQAKNDMLAALKDINEQKKERGWGRYD